MVKGSLVVDIERLRDICERFGIARLDVFGSVSHGDESATSDVDLLYALAPGARLGWKIEELTDDLERLFGRPVDLISRDALHDRLRDRVLAEAQPLYAA